MSRLSGNVPTSGNSDSGRAAAGTGMVRAGGIVLCGGQSRRMGRPKLTLPFGDELLLPRVCRILGSVVAPVIAVAAPDQPLPELPDGILVARDEYDALGPLAGLATGLSRLNELDPALDAAFVTSCDVPLLRPALVTRLLDLLEDFEAVVPTDGRFAHVLCGVYRTALAGRARELIAAGRLRPLFLVEESRSRRVPVESLCDVDPPLDSFRNINTPDEYLDALARAGLTAAPPGSQHNATTRET